MDHHLGEAAVDSRQVLRQVRRDHARIDRREAAADVDDIGQHAGAHQGAAGLGHRRLEGRRTHALAADVEADAHQVLGGAAGGQQQGGGVVHLDAELARQAVGRALGLHAHADDQVQVLGLAGGVQDLGQLFVGVEREGLHAVVEVRGRDGGAALDRVHEGHARARGLVGHQLDFVQRRDVERPHAGLRQLTDHPRRRIGLHRVEDVAFKFGLEPARGYGNRGPGANGTCAIHVTPCWKLNPGRR